MAGLGIYYVTDCTQPFVTTTSTHKLEKYNEVVCIEWNNTVIVSSISPKRAGILGQVFGEKHAVILMEVSGPNILTFSQVQPWKKEHGEVNLADMDDWAHNHIFSDVQNIFCGLMLQMQITVQYSMPSDSLP